MTITATHIGTATVLLRIGDLTVLTDPVFDPAGTVYAAGTPVELRSTVGPALPVSELPEIDLVLLSHDEHPDNLDNAGRALLAEAGTVITTASGAARLGAGTVGLVPWQSHVVTKGGTTLTITATPGRHGPQGCEPMTGDVIGFVVDDGSETVYLSGDTVYYDDLDEISQRHRVDVAFLHLGDARVAASGDVSLTMTAEQGAALAESLGAATVIPVHYASWEHFNEPPARIGAAFAAAGLTERLRWLTPGTPARLGS